MAASIHDSWLPVVFCLYIDIIFYQRYCVRVYVVYLKTSLLRNKELECMASLWARYRNMMSKYYWSFIVAFSMSMFVVLYYCVNEDARTDDGSNSSSNVLGIVQLDDREIYSTNTLAKHSFHKELTNTKCSHLHETALEMLSNGDRVALPHETSDTRWTFHKRGDLDYLKQIFGRWNQSRDANFSSFNFVDYGNTKSKDIRAKKYFITFACNCCEKSKLKAIKSARDPGGFDFATVHDITSLSKKFRYAHSAILRQKRGCGFWLWKPYIILKTFIESMSDNDLLMYQDAGAHLIRDAGPLLKLSQDLEPGIVVFHTRFLEKVFAKRDSLILMDMDDERVYNSYQRLASFVILRKNCQSLQFVMEWLAYAMDPRILTDIDNEIGKPNLPDFSENRHDQTVLSLLSKKWQLDEFRDPSQYGNTDQDLLYSLGPYRQLIFHSRDTS